MIQEEQKALLERASQILFTLTNPNRFKGMSESDYEKYMSNVEPLRKELNEITRLLK